LFTARVVSLRKTGRQRGFLDGHWAAYFWSSSLLTRWLDKRQATLRRRPCRGVDVEKNSWDLLKREFDALTHDGDVDAESIDEIFDLEFRRRFSELINKTARRNGTSYYHWPRS